MGETGWGGRAFPPGPQGWQKVMSKLYSVCLKSGWETAGKTAKDDM